MKILITGASGLIGINLIVIFQILICLIVSFQLIGCSTNQSANLENKTASSRFENQDFSKKPVNLNNEKERQKFEEISRELERNRSLWKEKNISNYDFELERFCEGMGGDWTRTFRVRENKILPLGKNDTYAPYQYLDKNSVEKLFDYTQQRLEEGNKVDVSFNKEYGYPEDIGRLGEGNGWESLKIKKLEIVK